MPKKSEPQSYDVLGDRYDQADDRVALIAQIVRERTREGPAEGISVAFQGDELRVRFHRYEQYLADRQRVDALYKESQKLIADFIREIKAEYRRRSGSALSVAEMKDRRDYDVQKVSLNERYYFIARAVFIMKGE